MSTLFARMMMSLLLLCLITGVKGESSVGSAPALVLPNDVSAAGSATPPLRTTTVYGFLDFTTTIDQTVVVFRPSSHAPSASSSANQLSTPLVIKSSASQTASLSPPPPPPVDDVDDGQTQPTTIRTEADDALISTRIFPTPTFNSKPTTPPPQSSSRNRINPASALADKRRRFLAQVRRQRPVPPNAAGSTPQADVSKARNAHHADQDMAETIDVIPSKVKRYHDGDVTVTDDVNGRNNRLLIRKLYRRPNHHSDVSSSKNRLLALRNRVGAKARFSSPARGRISQQPDDVTASQAVTAPLLTSSKPLFDPTSATIAEYLPIEDDDGVAADVDKPYKSLPSKPDVESKILLEGSQSEFPLLSTSLGDESSVATAPLPVLKTAREAGDPGLTVPIQLSIVTSTFSLTETRLRTSLLPVYDGTSTTYYTLTHSFLVTKTVTTFQTVPPEEFMPYLIPANDSINAINDVLPDWMDEEAPGQRKLDVTSDDEEDDVLEEANNPVEKIAEEVATSTTAVATDPLAIYGQQQHPGQVNPLLHNLPFLNLLGPAAALGLNPYFPYGLGQMGPQLVTTSRPVFSTSVVFTSKLLPIIDGLTTSYHTVRAPASTLTHTSYETYTTQLSPAGGPGGNPLGPVGGAQGVGGGAGGGMSTVVNPHTFVTTETQTSTQVFKLMYDGYKTSFRTVSSLTEVTRTVTTLTTTTVPLYTQPLLPFFG